jgi:hypothetical protein
MFLLYKCMSCGLVSSVSGQQLVVGLYKHDTEPLTCPKGEEFLHQLSCYYLLKKECSYLKYHTCFNILS